MRDGSKVPRTAYSPTAPTTWGNSGVWIAGTLERGKRKEERPLALKEERRKRKDRRAARGKAVLLGVAVKKCGYFAITDDVFVGSFNTVVFLLLI